jgi:hypothetical protein
VGTFLSSWGTVGFSELVSFVTLTCPLYLGVAWTLLYTVIVRKPRNIAAAWCRYDTSAKDGSSINYSPVN